MAPRAAAADFAPLFKPALEVRPAAGRIQIDGRLDDAGWSGAARTTRFVEPAPGENIALLVETEARLAYDDDNV